MGMSASQARLLSLEARQSNLEYQGQQINQARTVLSQQATALYNSLLSMTVPTPPATTDFQTVQYKGTQGASKFTIGTVTPTNNGEYDVELKYSRNGNCIKGGNYLEVTAYNEPEFITGDSIDNTAFSTPVVTTTINYFNAKLDNDGNPDELQAEELKNYPEDKTQVMHAVDVDYGTDTSVGGFEHYYYKENGSGRFIQANSYDEALENGGEGNVFVLGTIADIKKDFYGGTWDDGNEQEGANLDYVIKEQKDTKPTTETTTTGGFTLAQFQEQTFYDKDGNQLTVDNLVEKGTDAKGNKLYEFKSTEGVIKYAEFGSQSIKNPKYDPEIAAKGASVGGYTPQAFSPEVLGSSYSSALQAVANSYPEYKTGGQPDASKISSDFKVIFKKNSAGLDVPYFVKTVDYENKSKMSTANNQAQVEVFSLESNGSYSESVPSKGCKLTFDANGRITKIDIPILDAENKPTGKYDSINLEMETVVDEAAYNDAMAKYEYDTYLYDQKNKEINAKTEIIQQEDRNLELKLQRLDNERTQITTEIEAVEKVIKENIEKSYKTFNG